VTVVSQTLYLCGRVLRNLSRQPIWIVVMVVQPMFWLLLYSQLFRRITELPGFGTTSYIDYLTPGVAIMTAFFSGSWANIRAVLPPFRDAPRIELKQHWHRKANHDPRSRWLRKLVSELFTEESDEWTTKRPR